MSGVDRARAVEVFRQRLLGLIEREQVSRSAFAARAGMDRSTLSQLLSPGNERLPRAETVIAIAQAAQASVDWLLGLTEEEHRGAELLDRQMEIASGAASPVDERLAQWHREARGYKIRYVPTTLPDLLKTGAVLAYEHPPLTDPLHPVSAESAADKLHYSRDPDTEMEVCCPVQALEDLAAGAGIWRHLGVEARRRQIEHMARLAGELFPTFRWYLYDGLHRFSVPVTVFGHQRAVIYVGEQYFVFNTAQHIRTLSNHFDDLVKSATVQPGELVQYLESLLDRMN